jgi:hypothetical protein
MASEPHLDTDDPLSTRLLGLTLELRRIQSQIADDVEKSKLPVIPPKSYQKDERLVLLTARQRELAWYYETFGFAGICYWIYNIALANSEEEAEERARKGSGSTAANRTPRRSGTSNSVEDDYRPSSDAPTSSDHLPDDTDITNLHGGVDDLNLSANTDADTGSSSTDKVEASGHKSWRDVCDDWEKGPESRMLFALASLPPDLIPAIIYGDLPLRMQDRGFFSRVGAWVNCNDAPGVYGAFVAISPTTRDPHAPSIGTGPCLEHMLKAIDTMRLYTNLHDPASSEISKKIDVQYDPAPRVGDYNYKKQRKFAGGEDHRSFGLLEEDIAYLHQVYHEVEEQLQSTNNQEVQQQPSSSNDLEVGHQPRATVDLMKEPMRSPVYIGMSSNPSSRGSMHKSRPQSKLLGLFLSTLRYLYGDLYHIDTYTYQLFYALREEDIGFLEIVASIMGSGFSWDGGLAYTHAGGRPHGMHDIHKQRMSRAEKMILESGHLERNIRDSAEKMERVELALNVFENREVVEDMNRENQQRAEALAKEIENYEQAVMLAKLENWFAEYNS